MVFSHKLLRTSLNNFLKSPTKIRHIIKPRIIGNSGNILIGLHHQFTGLINDRAQFLMPLPLEGGSRERLDGNDGEPVSQLMSGALGNTYFLTAGGVYESPYEDGVHTQGGYVLGEFEYNLASDLKFKAKTKMANYKHSFALYVGGNGVNGGNPLALNQYVATVAPDNTGFTANYHSGPSVNSSDLVDYELYRSKIY